MSDRLYFAYGSNINLDQMACRCPDAQIIGPVTLNGYRLAFRSTGVATVIPEPTSQVKGLLWKLTPECEKSLDVYEGFPSFYTKDSHIKVMDKAGNEIQVMAYIMTREYEREPRMPPPGYFFGILEGYRQNGIPEKHLFAAIDKCKQEVEEADRARTKRQFRFDFSSFPTGRSKKGNPPER